MRTLLWIKCFETFVYCSRNGAPKEMPFGKLKKKKKNRALKISIM